MPELNLWLFYCFVVINSKRKPFGSIIFSLSEQAVKICYRCQFRRADCTKISLEEVPVQLHQVDPAPTLETSTDTTSADLSTRIFGSNPLAAFKLLHDLLGDPPTTPITHRISVSYGRPLVSR